MNDRKNTIAGWVLFAGIIALGGWVVTGEAYRGHEVEKGGLAIEGGDEDAGGGEADKPIAFYLASADVAAGEAVFKKCVSCHTVNQGGANGLGPNLWATVGKPLASHAGFAYSEALKSKGGTWTFDALSDWLANPRKFAPGNKMTFPGLGDPQDRANVIAYLNAQGSNLPFPPPPAEEAAPAEVNAAAPAEGNETAPAGNETAPANEAAPAPAQ